MASTSARTLNRDGRPVTMIVGATSKWRADGPNTVFIHGESVAESDLPRDAQWGLGGAIALKFARAGHFVVLTTRSLPNAEPLVEAIQGEGGQCLAVELEVSDPESISSCFDQVRSSVGDPEVLIYNAGYMAGRQLPPEQELMENFPSDLFETAIDIACRGPFLVAKEVLPAMRQAGRGSVLFSNNQYSLRGRKRHTGESLYYPRTMMRALSQALAAEYSEHGVHVANVVVDGFIDSPGTRELPALRDDPARLINPASIADAFFFLHEQEPSCWSHEIQLTSSVTPISY